MAAFFLLLSELLSILSGLSWFSDWLNGVGVVAV